MIKFLKIEKGKFKPMKQSPLSGAKYLSIISVFSLKIVPSNSRVLHVTITKEYVLLSNLSKENGTTTLYTIIFFIE